MKIVLQNNNKIINSNIEYSKKEKYGKYDTKKKIMIEMTWFVFYSKTSVQQVLQTKYRTCKKNNEKRVKEIDDSVLGNNRKFDWQVELLRGIIFSDSLEKHMEIIC